MESLSCPMQLLPADILSLGVGEPEKTVWFSVRVGQRWREG